MADLTQDSLDLIKRTFQLLQFSSDIKILERLLVITDNDDVSKVEVHKEMCNSFYKCNIFYKVEYKNELKRKNLIAVLRKLMNKGLFEPHVYLMFCIPKYMNSGHNRVTKGIYTTEFIGTLKFMKHLIKPEYTCTLQDAFELLKQL